MNELVEVRRGETFTDSKMVAEKFGMKNAYVVRIVENLLESLSAIKGDSKSPLIFQKEEREYRGQKFTVYLMNRPAFSMVAMRFTGDKAIEWQANFNAAFYEMERRILVQETNKQNLSWSMARQQGITARKEETDVIKDFVEYALSQGSQGAKFYYKHVTMACYKCLGLVAEKKPAVRDLLDVMQLNQLVMAEVVASRSIRKHMAAGEHYKVIFELVKQDLFTFAESLLLS